MTLGEILLDESKKLNSDILKLINYFEETYGVAVKKVDLGHDTPYADSTKVTSVNCKCEIHRA